MSFSRPVVAKPQVRAVPQMRISGYRQTQTREQWRQQIRQQYPSQFYNVIFTDEGAKITSKPDVPTAYGIDPVFMQKMGWARQRREAEPIYITIKDYPTAYPIDPLFQQKMVTARFRREARKEWTESLMAQYPSDRYFIDWTTEGATIQEKPSYQHLGEVASFSDIQLRLQPPLEYVPALSRFMIEALKPQYKLPPKSILYGDPTARLPYLSTTVFVATVPAIPRGAIERETFPKKYVKTVPAEAYLIPLLPQKKPTTVTRKLTSFLEGIFEGPDIGEIVAAQTLGIKKEDIPKYRLTVKNVYGQEYQPARATMQSFYEFAYVPVGAFSVAESFVGREPTMVSAGISYILTGGKKEVFEAEAEKISEHPGLLYGELIGEYFTAKAFRWIGGKAWSGAKQVGGKIKTYTPQVIKQPIQRGYHAVKYSHTAYVISKWDPLAKVTIPLQQKIMWPIKYEIRHLWTGSTLQKYLRPISYQIVGIEQTFSWQPSKFAGYINIPKELALRYAFEAHQSLYYPVALRAYQTELWRKFIQATTPKETPFTVLVKGKHGWTYETLEPKFAKVSETFKPFTHKGKRVTSLTDTFRKTTEPYVSGSSILEQITENVPKSSPVLTDKIVSPILKETKKTTVKLGFLSGVTLKGASEFWHPTAKIEGPPSQYTMETELAKVSSRWKPFPELQKTSVKQEQTLKNILKEFTKATGTQTQMITQKQFQFQEQQVMQQLQQIFDQGTIQPEPTPTSLTTKVDFPEIFEGRKRRRRKKEFDPFGIYGRYKKNWPTMGPKQVMKMKKIFEV